MIDRFGLVIGAMKCGTTSLFSYLAQHPQVCRCTIKENEFFAAPDRWARGVEWYVGLWPWDPDRHRVAIEASTRYAQLPRWPGVVERIASIDADFRFVYLMRDPVTRVESHVRHELKRGELEVPADGPPPIRPEMIDVTRYAMQLDAYRERFGRERLLPLVFEALRDEPDAVLARVCRFLGIDEGVRFRGVATPHNPSRTDHPVYTWLERAPVIPRLARVVPIRYKQAVRNRLARRLDVDVALDAEQRAMVLDALADDLDRLRDEYGVDTSRWSLDP